MMPVIVYLIYDKLNAIHSNGIWLSVAMIVFLYKGVD